MSKKSNILYVLDIKTNYANFLSCAMRRWKTRYHGERKGCARLTIGQALQKVKQLQSNPKRMEEDLDNEAK